MFSREYYERISEEYRTLMKLLGRKPFIIYDAIPTNTPPQAIRSFTGRLQKFQSDGVLDKLPERRKVRVRGKIRELSVYKFK